MLVMRTGYGRVMTSARFLLAVLASTVSEPAVLAPDGRAMRVCAVTNNACP